MRGAVSFALLLVGCGGFGERTRSEQPPMYAEYNREDGFDDDGTSWLDQAEPVTEPEPAVIRGYDGGAADRVIARFTRLDEMRERVTQLAADVYVTIYPDEASGDPRAQAYFRIVRGHITRAAERTELAREALRANAYETAEALIEGAWRDYQNVVDYVRQTSEEARPAQVNDGPQFF